MLGLAALGAGAWALFLRDEPAPTEPAAQTTAPTEEETVAGQAACGAEAPANAGEQKPMFPEPPEMQLAKGTDYRAEMKTSCGTVVIDLYEEQTPITVNSFVFLAKQGFYDGLTFHRVIKDFMIQGGDPAGNGTGGPGYSFEDEFVDSLTFDQKEYLLAMANSGPATNGSQFFVTTSLPSHLNGKHTIFGEVVEGQDVVDKIEALQTDAGDKPTATPYIESVTILES